MRRIEAAERAAVGEDSAESTIVGRWRTSEPASLESGLPEAQNAFCGGGGGVSQSSVWYTDIAYGRIGTHDGFHNSDFW